MLSHPRVHFTQSFSIPKKHHSRNWSNNVSQVLGFMNSSMGETVMSTINKAFLILPAVIAILVAIGILTS
tara:strand:+ start:873 stop:1082 length:210 start_codon:yes stop_codon:yes gene_type:complete